MPIELHGAAIVNGAAKWKPAPADSCVAACPACACRMAAVLWDGDTQPRAGCPALTPEEARSMPRLPLRFVRCLDCGHVFNPAFDSRHLPPGPPAGYRTPPAPAALDQLRAQILARLPANPVVIEIGYGGGAFLEALAQLRPGRYLGFDPSGAAESRVPGVELHRAPFCAATCLGALRPDLIISRLASGHAGDPLGLIDSLDLAAVVEGIRPLLYLEVPCADRAIETGCVEDFDYEHHSHFTAASFSRMAARGAGVIEAIGHGVGGEFLYVFLRIEGSMDHYERARRAKSFAETAAAWRHVLMLELADLYMTGKRVAVWGSTGAAAAFLNTHHMDAERFPLVVDSDPSAVGRYVPGTGQRIQSFEVLRGQPAGIVLIASWRNADTVVSQMDRAGITAARILVARQGRLADYRPADSGVDLDRATELILAAG